MDKRHDTALDGLMEQLIESGAENIGTVFARLFELAMQIERERFLGAQHYERSPSRQGYANGYKAIRKRIGAELRTIWNASTLKAAENALAELVKAYQSIAPKLAEWLEKIAPEGLTVFSLPDNHRRRMRTSNPMERAVQQEIKRRTQKVRVFPNEASLIRLVSAVLVEIDDQWAAEAKAYIKWEYQDA